MRPGLFAAVLLALAALGSPTLAEGKLETGSWSATCDNQGYCTAFLFSDRSRWGLEPAHIVFTRSGGRAGHLAIQMVSADFSGASPAYDEFSRSGRPGGIAALSLVPRSRSGTRLTFLVDGRPLRGLRGIAVPEFFCVPDDPCGDPSIRIADEALPTFLAALRRGAVLKVHARGARTFRFPLAGAGEILGWIDAQQNRTGTREALWNPGLADEVLPHPPR